MRMAVKKGCQQEPAASGGRSGSRADGLRGSAPPTDIRAISKDLERGEGGHLGMKTLLEQVDQDGQFVAAGSSHGSSRAAAVSGAGHVKNYCSSSIQQHQGMKAATATSVTGLRDIVSLKS
ncbi:unnamed protein product, partial [Amoebophrya sp. A120]|eukprot:GSA120T00006121001.1